MSLNRVCVTGKVTSNFVFDHEYYGEGFYKIFVQTSRLSGAIDTIPVLVSERIYNVSDNIIGKRVCVSGEVRTYNDKNAIHNKVKVILFADDIFETDEVDDQIDVNAVDLEGYICKINSKRTTPLGRQICDVIIAVNRTYGKSDYVPCVFWGKNAGYIERLALGSEVDISGRFQSRKYNKEEKELTVYEISVNTINVINENEAV